MVGIRYRREEEAAVRGGEFRCARTGSAANRGQLHGKAKRKQRSIKLATFVEHGWYLQSCRLATGRALTKEMTRKNTDALPRRERTGMEIPGASRVVDISAGSDSV